MATLATHLAIGALLGASMGLRMRMLVIAAILAALPDIDHFGPFASRVTLHNLAFCVALPALVLWPLAHRFRERLSPEIRRAVWAAPLLISSHLLLDMLPAPTEVSGASVALFYPISGQMYGLTPDAGFAVEPGSLSSFTFISLGLLALALLGRLVAADTPRARMRLMRPAVPLALLVAFPALALGGLVSPVGSHPLADLRIEDASLTLPTADASLTIRAIRGADAQPGSLRVTVTAGSVARNQTNREWVSPEHPWHVFLAMGLPPEHRGAIEATLTSTRDDHVYDGTRVSLVLAHLDANFTLASLVRRANGNLTASFQVEAPRSLPIGAVRITLTPIEGNASLELVNPAAILGGRPWNATFAPSPARSFDVRIVATTDGHVYYDQKGIALA